MLTKDDLIAGIQRRADAYSGVRARFAEAGVYRQAAEAILLNAQVYRNGGSAYFCGNGGSAADAEHFAIEFRNTPPFGPICFRAVELTGGSAVTAIGNDDTFPEVFAHQLRTMGRPGDILYGISTSGKAVDVHRALEAARGIGMYRVGIVGNGPLSEEIVKRSDVAIVFPTADTQYVQNAYIEILHGIWLGLKDVFSDGA